MKHFSTLSEDDDHHEPLNRWGCNKDQVINYLSESIEIPDEVSLAG